MIALSRGRYAAANLTTTYASQILDLLDLLDPPCPPIKISLLLRNDAEAEFELHEGANSLEQQQEASGRSDTVIAHKQPPTVPKDITLEPFQTYPEPSSGFPFPYVSMVTWLDPVQPDGLSVVHVNDDQVVSAPGSPTSTDGFMSLSLPGSQSSLIHRTVDGSDTTTQARSQPSGGSLAAQKGTE